MLKMISKGLDEIQAMNITDQKMVHFMLSRLAVLARYASEMEKQKGLYSEA